MRSVVKAIVVFVVFLILGSIVYAAVQYTLNMPQNATVTESSLSVYVDSVLYASSGQPLEWGQVAAGSTPMKQLHVRNNGLTPLRVFLLISNLPSSWGESWPANMSVISPSGWANATLTLTIPAGTAGGAYNWHSTISALDV